MSGLLKPEILAPAGGGEMLTAAVRSGADAVYLGAKEFSARRGAQNFDVQELKSAAEYCHIRGVKVYLALNIMLKENELEPAFALARDAYNYGIDGIIIQDWGLASALHRLIPGLRLHASTQCSVHSPAALRLLKEMGFTRVVAGREMSSVELKAFCREAERLGIEVEAFVHGALCMAVSGQCLMSAFLGSRSGNRGLCAGPCRLPFAVDGGTGYDLSLKDLSLLRYIRELESIGVSSFKIEGRMKRPEYVAAAVSACRDALDNGTVSPDTEETLKNVFSRSGFTAGYYESKTGRDMFGVRTKEDVSAAALAFPKLHELYRAERRSVAVKARLSVRAGKPISLSLDDGVNRVEVYGEVPQKAVNSAADAQSLKAGLDKFGSTPYNTEIAVEADGGLFVRAGELNALRRSAAEQLDRMRAAVKHPPSYADYAPDVNTAAAENIAESALELKSINSADEPKLAVRFENSAQIPEKLDGVSAIVFPLENDWQSLETEIPLIAEIPRGIVSERRISERLELFKSQGFRSALCGNLSAVRLAKEAGLGVIADTGLNICNSAAAAAARKFGAEAVLFSNEILLSDAVKLAVPMPKGIVAYGNIPLMLTRNCPLKNGRSCESCRGGGVITDRLGTEFRVRCRMGYSELLNSVPIWLADRMDGAAGLDFVLLYFTGETAARASEVIKAYMNGAAADVKYTRGLFYRGSL